MEIADKIKENQNTKDKKTNRYEMIGESVESEDYKEDTPKTKRVEDFLNNIGYIDPEIGYKMIRENKWGDVEVEFPDYKLDSDELYDIKRAARENLNCSIEFETDGDYLTLIFFGGVLDELGGSMDSKALKEGRGHTRTFSVIWDYKSGNSDSEVFGNEEDAKDFVFDELKEIAENEDEELDHIEIKYSEQYGGMIADEDTIFEWDSEDGELSESLGKSLMTLDEIENKLENGTVFKIPDWDGVSVTYKKVDDVVKCNETSLEYGQYDFELSLWDATKAIQNFYADGFEVVELNSDNNEFLAEANYGGAFDIEDNQFFTRDDLNELVDEINDRCPNGFQAVEAYMGDDGKTLEVVFDWDEYGQDSVYKKIDFRRIKKPSDLNTYADELIDLGKEKLGYIELNIDEACSHWKVDED